MEELGTKRRNSQPLEYPSAGSTFKRPAGAYAAALIDQCGLKGWSHGGARVSEKHAGFVISDGTASFDDVMAVMEHVQTVVQRETGFLLEPEVRIIRAAGI
jgi:UDP-N-acetylmuramate dehydrogenase